MTLEPPDSDNPSAAPGELELVRAFVNTLDIEAGRDRLATPGEARNWFADHEVEFRANPGKAELERLIELREAIRDAVAYRGSSRGSVALGALDALATAHPISVRLRGTPLPFSSSGVGVDGFAARVFGILAAAKISGAWDRLKACPNDRCRWLFFDHSRNRSRRWCSMDLCGARSKMRRLRARQRSGRGERSTDTRTVRP
jgi:predicted RNA-binding Zn ribbon-like protein